MPLNPNRLHVQHTPLHVAIHHGNLDIANILISQGASVDSRDKKNKVSIERSFLSYRKI